MRRIALLLLCFGFVYGPALACAPAKDAPAAPHVASAPAGLAARGALRPQPKPGERVRQPELDGYCSGPDHGAAFYYHGGSPVVRVARNDGCAPLFLTECEAEARCYPPRDQEPGMWCCAAPGETQTTAHAAR